MRQSSNVAILYSIPVRAKSGTEGRAAPADDETDARNGADDGDWFAELARHLHPNKPGTILHLTTGFAERACQKYASGEIRPPAYLLRALLRSENGWTYLAALMDGSTARWWLDLQDARSIGLEALGRARRVGPST